jgi:hypothetical protein
LALANRFEELECFSGTHNLSPENKKAAVERTALQKAILSTSGFRFSPQQTRLALYTIGHFPVSVKSKIQK